MRIVRLLATTSLLAMLTACGGGGGSSALPPSGAPVSTATYQPSPSASPAPTSAPVSAAAVPLHVPTWAFDTYGSRGGAAPADLVRRYVTYAEGGYGNAKALNDCPVDAACHSVFYMDPNFVYANQGCPSYQAQQFLSSARESWYVHEAGFADASHRIYGTYAGQCSGAPVSVPVYLANQNDPDYRTFMQGYLQRSADAWQYYFMDDTSTRVLTQTYGPGGGFCHTSLQSSLCTSTNEYTTDGSVLAAHESFASALTHTNGTPMQSFFNGVGFSGSAPANLELLQQDNAHFSGAVCEDCAVNAGALRPDMYPKILNAMAAVDAIPGASFVELNTGSSPAGSPDQIAQRLVTTAIAWLGFADAKTIVFADLETNTNGLAVWPEESIYPTQPVQSMSTGASDISVAPSIYRREFGQCYLAGAPIGPCAAVLNASASPVSIPQQWLQQRYGHLLSMTGGDVGSGGSIALDTMAFTAGASTVAPAQAVLLVR